MGDGEKNLPLHDEAKARADWRGGETIIDKGGDDSGPASEIDNASQGRGGAAQKGIGLELRPPD